MKLKSLLTVLILALTLPMMAQGELISTIKTNRYKTYGPNNQVSFWLGSTKDTEITVDFGYGPKTYTVKSDYTTTEGEEDSEEESVLVGGTEISGSVSSEGIIRIYGNASNINYINMHGSEIYDVDISKFWNLSILELSHNELHTLTLNDFPFLEFVRLNDNPFDKGLFLGDMIRLKYLNVNQMGDHALDHCNGVIDITKYKALYFFIAWDAHCLKQVDPSQCTHLRQLSIDNSGVSSLDVTKNQYLQILNIGDTPINSIDLSHNPYLVEFYAANEGQTNPAYKLTSIDLSKNTELQRIFLDGNRLTTLDVSKQWNLISLYAANNNLTSIKGVDINEPADQRPVELAYLDLSGNNFTFATLPEVDPMTYFYYKYQKEAPVAKEVCVGQPLDISHIACRKGTGTLGDVMLFSRKLVEDVVPLTKGIDYKIDNDDDNTTYKVTFLKEQKDSVCISLINDVFYDVALTTTGFLVRSADNYGKPVNLFTMSPAAPGEMKFTITTLEDENLIIDLGDGATQTVHTQAKTPTVVSVTANSNVTVKGRVATVVTALAINGVALTGIDLSLLVDLADLSITNCSLASIDLSWNHSLQSLDLSGNNIQSLDLTAVNDAFHKNVLSTFKATGNGMTSFNPGLAQLAIHSIDLSDNALESFETTDFENLVSLNLANNKLSELVFSECESLVTLNVSSNSLSSLDVSTCTALQNLDASRNNMRYSSMPEAQGGYTLAPQSKVAIASRAGTCDLSSEAIVRGVASSYAWRDEASGQLLAEGTDYTVNNGRTTFLAPANGRTVHCEISNALYPEFTGNDVLTTTPIAVMGTPEYEVASFTTPVGEEPISLSLASIKDNSYIYIDWGNGEFIEYPLVKTYTLFQETNTIAGSKVKVYSNEAPHGNIGIFSISGVTMSYIDVSKMTELYCLTLENAGLTSIDLSKNLKIRELNLNANRFKTIDLSNLHNINLLSLSNNGMESFKLAENNNIQWFFAADNMLKTVDMNQLKNVYNADFTSNYLETIDISPAKSLGQLFLANNILHEIDLSNNPQLTALNISYNCFDFSTLPNPAIFANAKNFSYGDQQTLNIECIDSKIDLSSQVSAWGQPSQIFFFDNYVDVYEDEEGNLTFDAGEFVEGEDFQNDNGIISFFKPQPRVVGAIMNPLYPELILYTNRISVTAATAITAVKHHNDATNQIYNIAGQRVNGNAKGILIKNGKKVVIK